MFLILLFAFITDTLIDNLSNDLIDLIELIDSIGLNCNIQFWFFCQEPTIYVRLGSDKVRTVWKKNISANHLKSEKQKISVTGFQLKKKFERTDLLKTNN